MSATGYVILAYAAGLGLLVGYGGWLLVSLWRLGRAVRNDHETGRSS